MYKSFMFEFRHFEPRCELFRKNSSEEWFTSKQTRKKTISREVYTRVQKGDVDLTRKRNFKYDLRVERKSEWDPEPYSPSEVTVGTSVVLLYMFRTWSLKPQVGQRLLMNTVGPVSLSIKDRIQRRIRVWTVFKQQSRTREKKSVRSWNGR